MNKPIYADKNKTRIIRVLLLILFAITFFAAAIPCFYKIFNAGSIILFTFSILFLLYALLYNKLNEKFKKVINILIIIYIIISLILFISVLNSFFLPKIDPLNPPQTAIVLGCMINEDRPSKMLMRRLNKAVEFHNLSPNSAIIVTGGQGENEKYPESTVMYNYLVENGVNPNVIYNEDKSENTKENFEFSSNLIYDNNLSSSAVVITDGFHQLRAKIYAHRYNISSVTLSSKTPLSLLPISIYREFLGIIKAVILK